MCCCKLLPCPLFRCPRFSDHNTTNPSEWLYSTLLCHAPTIKNQKLAISVGLPYYWNVGFFFLFWDFFCWWLQKLLHATVLLLQKTDQLRFFTEIAGERDWDKHFLIIRGRPNPFWLSKSDLWERLGASWTLFNIKIKFLLDIIRLWWNN